MKRHLLTLTLAVAGLAFAQETPAAATAEVPSDPNAVVATYGDTEMTLGQFETEYHAYAGRLLNQQGMTATPENYRFFDAYREQILKEVVNQIVTTQLANEMGYTADPAALDAQIAQIRANFPDEATYLQAVKDAGIQDEAFLRELIGRDLAVQQWLQAVSEKAEISEPALKFLYTLEKRNFQRSAQACVRHILVKTPEEAQAVRDRLTKGEAFADVAKAVSQDPGSAAQGGDLGCFAQGETVPEFDKASFEGPQGEVQQVTTQFGTHVLIVDKRNEAGMVPFEEAKEQIAKGLKDRAAYKVIQARVAKVAIELDEEAVHIDAPAPAEGAPGMEDAPEAPEAPEEAPAETPPAP